MTDSFQLMMDRAKELLARIHKVDPDLVRFDVETELGMLAIDVDSNDYDYSPKHSPFLYDTWMELLICIRSLFYHKASKLRFSDHPGALLAEIFSDFPPGWEYADRSK